VNYATFDQPILGKPGYSFPVVKQIVGAIVEGCEHKYGSYNNRPPKHINCTACWNHYFRSNPGQITACKSTRKIFGEGSIEKSRGRKYARQFDRFVATRGESVVEGIVQ
jgi:hypothetical protein